MATIFFAGGGTLGPVTPLLAVYQELKRRQCGFRVVWIGTADGPEREKVTVFPEIVFETLPEAKFDRFVSLRLLIAPLQFFAALVKSVIVIIRYRPSLIVGSGGFTQVPLIWVGKQFGISCLIHQMDVALTLSNRLCAWAANRITVNFGETAKYFPARKTAVVGNPVFVPPQPPRSNENVGTPILRKGGTGGDVSLCFDVHKPLLVVIGGGTGAEQLNSLVGYAVDGLTQVFNVVLITGWRNVPTSVCNRNDVTVIHFVKDSYHLLEKADIVVARAGMATLTELAALGKPAILIPIPRSHQEANARYYEERGAARVFWCDYDETEKRVDDFIAIVKEVWYNQTVKDELAKNITALYRSDAAQYIMNEIMRIIAY